MSTRRIIGLVVAAAGLLLLVLIPLIERSVGGILPGPLNSVGSLQLLALVLIAAATAVTLDVLFGYTGLLSMGHALYFGIGCYSVVMFSRTEGIGFPLAVLLALLVSFLAALAGNATALKLTGFGYAMATLALAQLLTIAVERGYGGSGGEEGLLFETGTLPSALVGLDNTRNLYWAALALLVVVLLVCRALVRSEAGHVWQAIRENPMRAEALGYDVYRYRLASATLGSFLAGGCGIVYALVMGGANPSIIQLEYSLGLILMVVLGGSGRLWGAALGGGVYMFLNLRLSAIAESGAVADLPRWLEVPLSQPNFLLGVVLVLVILFVPGGLASLVTGRRPGRGTSSTHSPNPNPTSGPTSGTTPGVLPDGARVDATS